MIHVKKASVLFKGQICNVILQACELLGGNLNRTQLLTIMVVFLLKKGGVPLLDYFQYQLFTAQVWK